MLRLCESASGDGVSDIAQRERGIAWWYSPSLLSQSEGGSSDVCCCGRAVEMRPCSGLSTTTKETLQLTREASAVTTPCVLRPGKG